MSADEQRSAIYETWETMAPGWERWAEEIERTSAPVREWLLAALAPSLGDTVLEIAAGPGDTGLAAAPLVGEGGRIIFTDLVPAMVDIARRRGEALGMTNVEHRVMDAERLELEDRSVDGVLCRFGYMLVPDCATALAEARRVLRPDGRLALAVWRGAEQNPWISIAGRMLVERCHMPRPEPGEPGIFALADEERLSGLLEVAGFTVGRVEDVHLRFDYSGLENYIRRAQDTGGVFARIWAGAPEDERTAIRAELETGFAPYEVDGRYELPGVALCAVAA